MADYVKYLRDMVGKKEVILTASCCIIQNGRGDILLQQRSDSKKWGLPGGIMELYESAEEAAVREVFEETGLLIEIDYLQGVYSKYFAEYKNGDKAQVIVFAFYARRRSGDLKIDGKETLALRYFNVRNLPEIFCKQHEDIINDFTAGKRSCFR